MNQANESVPVRPNRVAAPEENHMRRVRFSPEGLQKLRETALRNRPWERSTGPRSAAGKARSAANGKTRQKGPKSVREARAEVAALLEQLRVMRDCRPC